MFKKSAITSHPIQTTLAERWSGRAYDHERPVERQTLMSLFEAARWAPSCFGYQPWRFILWDKSEEFQTWLKAFECLSEGNRSWAIHAPILILVCADTRFADGKPNRWCQYDTGAAAMSLSVEATARGLMVHQMGGFDADRIRAEFSIPDTIDCLAVLTVGYQLPEESIPQALQEREFARRSRLELADCFFESVWDRPLR